MTQLSTGVETDLGIEKINHIVLNRKHHNQVFILNLMDAGRDGLSYFLSIRKILEITHMFEEKEKKGSNNCRENTLMMSFAH